MGVIGEAVAPRVGLSQAERRPGDDAVLQGAVLSTGIAVGIGQSAECRAGQAAVGQGEADHRLADVLQLALRFLGCGGFALRAKTEHQPAGQQPDNDQHYRQFDQ